MQMANSSFPSLSSPGIGLTHNNEPVPPGTVIVADADDASFGVIRCHSGSRDVGAGHWILPNESLLIESNSLYTVTRNGEGPFSFISLEISNNSQLSQQGQYICVLPNEGGDDERTAISIYHHDHAGKFVNYHVSSSSSPGLYFYQQNFLPRPLNEAILY